jgi:hypothetical protein
MVDIGIQGGPPVYREAMAFWEELVELDPAEAWFGSPLAIYMVSYLNFMDSRGYNPWKHIATAGAQLVEVSADDWNAWADATVMPGGWGRTVGRKLITVVTDASNRSVGRVNFCMAMEARRLVVAGDDLAGTIGGWMVPSA